MSNEHDWLKFMPAVLIALTAVVVGYVVGRSNGRKSQKTNGRKLKSVRNTSGLRKHDVGAHGYWRDDH